MTRIAIIERADMNAEQTRVYDAAKNSGGVVGGPYYAYIRLPKLFEAAQNLRTCLRSGPLSGREGQIANLVIARYWNAKYPWYAQARRALDVCQIASNRDPLFASNCAPSGCVGIGLSA